MNPTMTGRTRTSRYNRLVTIAVAFGSLVRCTKHQLGGACPQLIHHLTDLRLLVLDHWKHHWPAWLVRILRSTSDRRAGIWHENDQRHRDSQRPLQRRRRHRLSLHHVGCYGTGQKTLYPVRSSDVYPRRRFARRSCCSWVSYQAVELLQTTSG